MNTYALPALKERRAKLDGEKLQLKQRIINIENQLIAIDTTIKIFDPDFDPTAIRSINPRKRVNIFRMGEVGRMIIDALRKADGEPLNTGQVADYIIAVSKLDSPEGKQVIYRSSATNLNYLARRGKILKLGKGMGTTWRLVLL
jgi:hypothetical protein